MTTTKKHLSTEYWYKMPDPDERVVCTLCPRECKLAPGRRGFCYIRMAINGEIALTAANLTSGIAVDPIEKKPLYQFLPNTKVLSFGAIGCNLGCKFCQNWHISKTRDEFDLSVPASPSQLVAQAISAQCSGIAYTYNEPIISMEFVLQVAKEAKTAGLKSIAVSAGFIQEKPRERFFSAMDAANIDLKSFDHSFYQKLTGGGNLSVIIDTLRYVKHHSNCWLEITNLIIPGYNDDFSTITKMCDWIVCELGQDVPLHFSAFHPDYQLTEIPPTPAHTILAARDIAIKSGIRYVYTGNIRHPQGTNTYCHHCQQPLIERQGWSVNIFANNGICPKCHTQCAGIFTQKSELIK
ncbi:MAG: AmmeMemoRadiSam system radical SAM enzyme [Oligoflexia bacterium]|nr:AmmeMemoRadiSam system radical SAM enzyme [Oligoflexia bacterium]